MSKSQLSKSVQLSLVEELPEFDKKIFLDVFAEVHYVNEVPRLQTIVGQAVPGELKVRCLPRFVAPYPAGTIYKMDVRLVRNQQRRPYFVAVSNRDIRRAVEFFEHNLGVQTGVEPAKKKAVVRIKAPKNK